MKTLVFSDSHNDAKIMNELAEKYRSKIDCIIHLGDCTDDTFDFRIICPDITLYQVRGNNDCGSLYPSERTITLGGKRIYMTHGHRQKVYYNTDNLYFTAAQEQADIALFGHTHIPYLENEGGILVMNPGSISLPRGNTGKTFAFISIERGNINVSVMGYSPKGIQRLKTL